MPAKPASCWPTPAPTCRPSWAKDSSRASTTPSVAHTDEEAHAAETAATALVVDREVLAHDDAIGSLAEQRGSELARRTRLVELSGHQAHYQDELNQQLRRLGPQCDEPWLRSRPEAIESEPVVRAA